MFSRFIIRLPCLCLRKVFDTCEHLLPAAAEPTQQVSSWISLLTVMSCKTQLKAGLTKICTDFQPHWSEPERMQYLERLHQRLSEMLSVTTGTGISIVWDMPAFSSDVTSSLGGVCLPNGCLFVWLPLHIVVLCYAGTDAFWVVFFFSFSRTLLAGKRGYK